MKRKRQICKNEHFIDLLMKIHIYFSIKRTIMIRKAKKKQALPEGWREVKLGDVCGNITTGKLDVNAAKPKGQYRFYTCAKEWYQIDNYAFDDEALLISGNGVHVGYIHYYKGKFNAYQRTYVLTGFSENIKYLHHYMNQYLKDRIRIEVNDGNVPYIRMNTLTNMPITLPIDCGEQKTIASLLEKWDTAIEKTEALIAAKEKQFKWLVTFLINKKLYQRTHVSVFTTELSNRNHDGVIDRVLSVTNHSGFILPEEQFGHRVASADISNYKIVSRGQYAYNPSRINVGSIARLDDWNIGILSPMYVVLKLDERKIHSDYFLYWISSSEAKQRIKNSTQGSVRETVSFNNLGTIPIPLPSMADQKHIANILNAAQNETILLKKLAEKCRTQKRGLMQKLLTGIWQL